MNESQLETQLAAVQKQSIATAIQYICTHAETYYEAVRRAAHLAGARPEMFLLRAVFALDLTRIAVPRGGAIPLASLPNAATEAPKLRRAVPQLFNNLEPSFQETLQRLASSVDVHRQFVCWVTVEGEGLATHDIGRSVHAGAVIDALDHRPTWVGHLGGRIGSAGDNMVPPNQFNQLADGRFVPNVNAHQQQQQIQQQQQYYQQQQQRNQFASPQQQQQYYQDPNSQMVMNNNNARSNPLVATTNTGQSPWGNLTQNLQQQYSSQQQQQQNPQSSMITSPMVNSAQKLQQQQNMTPGGASQYFGSPNNNNVVAHHQNPLLMNSATNSSKQLPPTSPTLGKQPQLNQSTASSANNNNNNNKQLSSQKSSQQIPQVLDMENLDKIDEYLAVSHMCSKASTKCIEHIQTFNVRLDELHSYTSSLQDKFDDSRNVARDLDAAVELLMQKLQATEKKMLILENPKPITQVELKKKEEDEKELVARKAREEAMKLLDDLKGKGQVAATQTTVSGDEVIILTFAEMEKKEKDYKERIKSLEEQVKDLKEQVKKVMTTSGKDRSSPQERFSALEECPYCTEPGTKFCKSSGRRHETQDERAERRWKHVFRQMSLMASFVSTARLSKKNTIVSDGAIELVL